MGDFLLPARRRRRLIGDTVVTHAHRLTARLPLILLFHWRRRVLKKSIDYMTAFHARIAMAHRSRFSGRRQLASFQSGKHVMLLVGAAGMGGAG